MNMDKTFFQNIILLKEHFLSLIFSHKGISYMGLLLKKLKKYSNKLSESFFKSYKSANQFFSSFF